MSGFSFSSPVFHLDPDENDAAFIEAQLKAYNNKHAAKEEAFRRLSTTIRNEQGVILAGLAGKLYAERAFIEFFWASDELRGQGAGRSILQTTEAALRELGCKRIYLFTASFQAPGFYCRMGYEETGVDESLPGEDKRHFFRKAL